MEIYRRYLQVIAVAFALLACALSASAQVSSGNVRGIVTDPNGAAVPNAKVTITQKSTNVSQTTQTTGGGEFEFKNLLPAEDYSISVEAQGFKALTLNDVKVQLNQTTDVPAQLTVGGVGETVEVTVGGAELVDTTTQNLSKSFNDRQVVELAQSSTGLGVYNLALIAPNVVSSGGVGVGSGGSVGGQRARNNNFVVDGIDNNDKSVTGPQVYISPETVQEFNLLSNQYSAEFARSTGGQFILTTKSGTNQFHGTAYFFGRNRKLEAIDTLDKQPGSVFVRDQSQVNEAAGITRQPRSDYFRIGGNVGGPIIHNKLFFFGSFERIGIGSSAGTVFSAPTAAGYAQLATIPGVNANILGMVRQFVPAAPSASSTISVGGQSVPIGDISLPAPNFFTRKNWVANIDYTQSTKTQHRWRFIKNDENLIDIAATLPQFFALIPTNQYLFSYTNLHTFTAKLSNETRLAFRRSKQIIPVPDISFPLAGFDQFPNVTIEELGVSIGPDGNAPQFTIENNYQIIDNVTYLFGNHSLKFGGDFRKIISPQSFVQRQRGDYDFNNLSTLLTDQVPDLLAERNVGANTYYGDQKLLFAFVQDDWRVRPNLTLNLGLNYAYQQVPFGARQQNLNAISTVPGLISFDSPKSQKRNFAPRVGFAYAPNFTNGWGSRLFGKEGQTSIRAGFSMAYDVIFDNIYILSSPPQFQQTIDCGPPPNDPRCAPVTSFITGGGIHNIVAPTGSDAAATREATTSWIPDQKVPYSLTWTGSIQRQFLKDWSFEARYLGTRGVHLLTQNRINRQNRITDTDFVPTFLSMPSTSVLAGLTNWQTIRARNPSFVPKFSAAGFDLNSLVAFLPNGNSTYHAASGTLTHRFTRGYQMTAAYTWSHLIDDTTAEVFSTILSPRRVEDFQNLRRERADSALDRRHRFVLSSLYTMPYFSKSENRLVRALLGGFNFAGTLTFESGEKAVVRSGIDSNQNGDSAGDRTIINPSGTPNTFSLVCAVAANGQFVTSSGALTSNASQCTNSPSNTAARTATVAYVALNPNAQYIQAGLGAHTNAGRNTLQLPGIRNLDFSVFKNFHITEGKFIQLRADLFNAFNHPQWTPGSVNGGEATSLISGSAANINNIQANGDFSNPSFQGIFNRPDLVYSSHPRVIQLALRFNF
jgi:Carboxypeptidase regulatory-like domain